MSYQSDYSGAQVEEAIGKALNPDATPTADSTNLVESGGVYDALAPLRSVDAVPTQNSTNLVQSGGVYAATGGFVPTIHTGIAPAAGGAYRQTAISSAKEAYLVEVQYQNANGSWYSLNSEQCTVLPFMQDGSICELRFTLMSGSNAAAGRPLRALILAR